MRRIAITIALAIATVAGGITLYAQEAECMGCGMKPFKPMTPPGCRDLIAQCKCDGYGNCYWEWVCVTY
jgi:hypothetical protein